VLFHDYYAIGQCSDKTGNLTEVQCNCDRTSTAYNENFITVGKIYGSQFINVIYLENAACPN
jgi:hypothetical protein